MAGPRGFAQIHGDTLKRVQRAPRLPPEVQRDVYLSVTTASPYLWLPQLPLASSFPCLSPDDFSMPTTPKQLLKLASQSRPHASRILTQRLHALYFRRRPRHQSAPNL